MPSAIARLGRNDTVLQDRMTRAIRSVGVQPDKIVNMINTIHKEPNYTI